MNVSEDAGAGGQQKPQLLGETSTHQTHYHHGNWAVLEEGGGAVAHLKKPPLLPPGGLQRRAGAPKLSKAQGGE